MLCNGALIQTINIVVTALSPLAVVAAKAVAAAAAMVARGDVCAVAVYRDDHATTSSSSIIIRADGEFKPLVSAPAIERYKTECNKQHRHHRYHHRLHLLHDWRIFIFPPPCPYVFTGPHYSLLFKKKIATKDYCVSARLRTWHELCCWFDDR